jgi:hypothetical protein
LKGKVGRPRIPRRHVAFIRRISGNHPEWCENKIAEELAAKFEIHHSASTIPRAATRPTRPTETIAPMGNGRTSPPME